MRCRACVKGQCPAKKPLEHKSNLLTADITDKTDADNSDLKLFAGVYRIGLLPGLRMPILYEELSGKIIGAAMQVLNAMKPGLDEKIYENALVLELRESGHLIEQQKSFPVYYNKNTQVGTLIPDLIIDQVVIVDPKVVTTFTDTHIAQMTGYLAITDLTLAILLNFKNWKLEWKRVIRQQKFVPLK